MQVPTHIMSGWCAANLVGNLTPRQRSFCMIAASIADLDGLSILGGQEAYWRYHHLLCHNLMFGLLTSGIPVWFSSGGFRVFILYLTLFHLHLWMDFFGSGPGWEIYYFWPLSKWFPSNLKYAWNFYSWQNLSIAGGLLICTILIAIFQRRTPLEAAMPELDRQLVDWLRRPFKKSAMRRNN